MRLGEPLKIVRPRTEKQPVANDLRGLGQERIFENSVPFPRISLTVTEDQNAPDHLVAIGENFHLKCLMEQWNENRALIFQPLRVHDSLFRRNIILAVAFAQTLLEINIARHLFLGIAAPLHNLICENTKSKNHLSYPNFFPTEQDRVLLSKEFQAHITYIIELLEKDSSVVKDSLSFLDFGKLAKQLTEDSRSKISKEFLESNQKVGT